MVNLFLEEFLIDTHFQRFLAKKIVVFHKKHNLSLINPCNKVVNSFCKRAPLLISDRVIPDGNYMFKVNNRNTKTMCEICSKLTVKT